MCRIEKKSYWGSQKMMAHCMYMTSLKLHFFEFLSTQWLFFLLLVGNLGITLKSIFLFQVFYDWILASRVWICRWNHFSGVWRDFKWAFERFSSSIREFFFSHFYILLPLSNFKNKMKDWLSDGSVVTRFQFFGFWGI